MNAACYKLLRECRHGIVHLPISSLFNPVASWVFEQHNLHPPTKRHVISGHGGAVFGPLHAHTTPACVSPLYSPKFFKICPHLPLRVLNMNLILLFIAFACLINRPPLLNLSLTLQLLEMCPVSEAA